MNQNIELFRCCGRKPRLYKRPHFRYVCLRCCKEYDANYNQVENWAWAKDNGIFRRLMLGGHRHEGKLIFDEDRIVKDSVTYECYFKEGYQLAYDGFKVFNLYHLIVENVFMKLDNKEFKHE